VKKKQTTDLHTNLRHNSVLNTSVMKQLAQMRQMGISLQKIQRINKKV